MVFKVAGNVTTFDRPTATNIDDTDVSLAAFGRKEIEIAEVIVLHRPLS